MTQQTFTPATVAGLFDNPAELLQRQLAERQKNLFQAGKTPASTAGMLGTTGGPIATTQGLIGG